MGSGTWRKAYDALNDSTKVGLTNLTARPVLRSSDYPAKNFGSLQDLDIAIVKATNHVECPPKERHFRRIMFSTSVNRPRADVAYSISSANPPHFIHLCYKPVGGNVKRKLAIVGKGLTFDSMGIYITRWSAKRLREIANTVKGKKRDVVSKSSFGDLLHISLLPPPPEALVDFIVMKIDTKKRLLKLTDRKKISLTRDLVKKIFNVPSGSRPLEFGKRGESDFREIYLDGERVPIPTTVSVLSNADDDDEDTIDRTWILLCLSLVLALMRNMVPLEYLHSLQDMSVVHEFEWDEHILLDAMREVKKYQDKRNEGKLKFHIGGCLPMLPVIYMDHIDIPRGCIVDHSIDYSLPRACFVKELDFTVVIAVDTMEDGFGKRPFSSTTPYATTKFLSYIEQLPPHMRAIFNKHNDIHAAELKDVTFDVPAALLATCNATASDSSHSSRSNLIVLQNCKCNREYFISAEPKQHEIRYKLLQNCSMHVHSLNHVQQASQLNDTNSVETKVVVGKTDFAHQPHKSKSKHNSGIDFSNAKGEDICREANKFERMSPRSTSYPCVNLIRRLGTLEDGPSFRLFEPGSPDALLFQDVPQVESPPRSPAFDIESFMEIREGSPKFDNLFAAATSPGPVYDVTPLSRIPPISTGPAEACIDDITGGRLKSAGEAMIKHPTLKRAAPTEPTAAKLPKMKKKKIDAMDDAIYQSMGIYITRWSAKRLREIANTVKGKKRDVVSKSSFGDLLHISPLPPPPEALVDFIVMRIDTKKRLLKLTDRKKISLTRDLVKKIFNVPSGSRPLEFGKRGKSDFREIYLEGERAPIPTTVSVLSNADDDDEDTIDRTWILLCLSLVLAPGTGNMVPLEYLHSLQDMSVVHEFEWDEHILLDAMREVKKYQDKRNEGKLKFHIGGCLPMLPVIYMDHIDIPRGCIVDHSIDYSLPRACFVKELDFTAVIAVDTMEDGFGKRPFSSTTPYATTKFLSYIEQVAELPNIASVSATENPVNRDADGAEQPTEGGTNEADGRARNVHEPPPKNMEGGDDVCGSLEDWLHPLPTFEDSELPPHMRAIFNKHKDIHAAELKGALSSFGSLLEGIYRKRMGLMLSEASKAGFRSDEAKHECPDVTFDVPAAPAPATCNATASDSSPQQQKQLDSATGTANATVNISSPQQPKQHEIRVQVTTATAQCTFTASTVQQASQLNDTNSVETKVVVGKTDFAHQPHKSKSKHNSGIDFSNAKGEDICREANKFERMSPRSTSYPCVNLIRRLGTLEDGPSFGLFEPGSPDALLFQDVPQVESPPRSPAVDIESFMEIREGSPKFDNLFAAATSPGPVYDVTPLARIPPISTGPAEACIDDITEEAQVEVSSGRGHDQKHPTLKRAAPTEPTAAKLPKMKKKKIDAMDDAIYQRYCCTNYKIKDPPRGEPLNGLKKRAHVNNEVMSLYIESFNIEHMYNSSKPRKFAFSPHVTTKLSVDPSSFNPNSCTKDFKRACEKNDIAKSDQLFFTIVKQDHWALVVVNLMHKQFNVFDSNSQDSDYVSILEKPCCNLVWIENFKTLVRERNPWKHDLDKFERFNPSGYPQQSTTFDCGLFAILYMENLTAKGLKPFSTDTTSLLNFRKYIAAKLFKHPQNTLSSEEELQKLLKKS
ncbi:hypothetical protein ZWY2020_002844 [Hordeum vulgare]|nr:hypothetical protein ZWY2020_002844 [Hordeum vulgare]